MQCDVVEGKISYQISTPNLFEMMKYHDFNLEYF